MKDLIHILENKNIVASAPCRIDMGGTQDIPLFNYYLKHLSPVTFNIAVNMRTRISLLPHKKGKIRISSKGFVSEEFSLDKAPFNHSLGLMFAIASYFRIHGVHIRIESESPPRSALGGSSTASIALISAFSSALGKRFSKEQISMIAYNIESIVAGVPCGIQDQLAATYGGINAWHFPGNPDEPRFIQESLYKNDEFEKIEKIVLLAYCGIPHESKDVNGKWVKQFMRGRTREMWFEIVNCTKDFIKAFKEQRWNEAVKAMNKEVEIRREMTPEVLDETGIMLVESAINNKCGARFTGAGGGGCLWAIGNSDDIVKLKILWEKILEPIENAELLNFQIDKNGVKCTE